MLDLSKVTFPLSLVIGDVKLILIGARPTIEYVNGKRSAHIEKVMKILPLFHQIHGKKLEKSLIKI